MELLQLRYFQKVAEMESITKASNFFMIPQPSMSQTISRLEKELGVKLFDRRNGKLFLNERGRNFLRYVNQSLLDLENGIAAVTEQAENISGTVKIKVMENHRFILTCIPQFAERYPDVSISVSHGYYEDPDVTYDLCVTSRMAYRNMTASEALIKEQLVLAVSWKGRFRNNTVLIPMDDPTLCVTSFLLWDENRYLSPAIRKFRDYLLTEAKKLENNLI